MNCRFLLAATASLLFVNSTFAGETTGATACRDRSDAPYTPVDQSRLTELTYECASLGVGRVLIGRAGPAAGESIVLIHGLGSNAHHDWRNVIPDLATTYKVMVLDLPGFGASDTAPRGYAFETLAATISEVLDRESIARTHVVGHSLGGAVALYFAHTYPQRTSKLVLVDAAGILLKSVYLHHVSSKFSIPEVGFSPLDRLINKVDSRINHVSRRMLFRVENRFDFSTWLADNPTVRVPLLGRFTQTDAALGLIEHDFTRAIRETKAPTTIIWGRNDNVSPVRVGVLLAGRLSDARLHVIERSGHVPMNDAVDEFKSLLAQALARPPAPKPIIATTTYRALNVECRDQSDQVYTGSFATLSLQSCRHARIEDARVTQLVMNDSSATLESVTIDSPDTAVTAVNSFITATVLDASGRIAIKTVNSQLDLAGTSIRAREKGVETDSASRVYFSVSDMQSAGYSGGLHGIWDEPEAAQ